MNEANLKCRCGCGMDVTPEFRALLGKLERACGFELQVNRGASCAAHNAKVATTGSDGPHTFGEAVDIGVSGARARQLAGEMIRLGFTGIGISQKGPHEKRFIHGDTLDDRPGHPRPWMWSY